MRVPYSWLREVVSAGAPGWDVSPRGPRAALIRIGHEVEDVIPLGPVSGPLTMGRVTEIEELTEFKKPIRACKVDVGEPEPRDIVCGATNFAVGDLVVVALPGSTLPGDFHIASRKTYGRLSDGMICSAAELGLGSDQSGIMVFPPGTAEPGDSGVDVLGLDDVVFDLAITPDRGYGMSVRGIAREIACAYDLNFVDPADVAPLPVDGDAWPLTVDAGTGVSRFALRPVTGIDQHALSPWWMRRRLMLCGIRPISPAVDVTNYVMLEFGHPMHAHDRDRIHGGFGVRFAEPGETVRDPRRRRTQARSGGRADRRRGRDGGHRRRDGCGQHRDKRRVHRRAAGGRGVGSRCGVPHAAAAAPGQRGRPALRTRCRPGDFGGRPGSVCTRCWPKSPVVSSSPP